MLIKISLIVSCLITASTASNAAPTKVSGPAASAISPPAVYAKTIYQPQTTELIASAGLKMSDKNSLSFVKSEIFWNFNNRHEVFLLGQNNNQSNGVDSRRLGIGYRWSIGKTGKIDIARTLTTKATGIERTQYAVRYNHRFRFNKVRSALNINYKNTTDVSTLFNSSYRVSRSLLKTDDMSVIGRVSARWRKKETVDNNVLEAGGGTMGLQFVLPALSLNLTHNIEDEISPAYSSAVLSSGFKVGNDDYQLRLGVESSDTLLLGLTTVFR